MAFKKLRGVKIPARKQLLIRAICLNYDDLPAKMKKNIKRLCAQCGGDYSVALFDTMTTEKSILTIAQEQYISDTLIYNMRKKFYESWDWEQFLTKIN